MVISAFAIFTLFGRVMTTYEANNIARIEAVLREVYIDIAIALFMLVFLANTPTVAYFIHYLTIKFIFMNMANYSILLATEVD